MTLYNLAAERMRIGMNQTELAEKLNCSVSTVVRWEKDISTMPAGTLKEASALFGCSTDYLMGRTDDRLIRAVQVV